MTRSSSQSQTVNEGKRFVPDFANETKYSKELNEALKRLDDIPCKPRSKELRQKRAEQLVHPTNQILTRLHNPNRHLNTVHVTGSKGKGTTSAMIAAALQIAPFSNGRPIGIYNSPHLVRINERVRINGEPIRDDIFAEALNGAMDAREKSPVVEWSNRFNILVAAALAIFGRQNCWWTVVEVGIGGRKDSTNVISAPVSVITNIFLEHADVIGPTLEDIAYEKAGIIAPGSTVIVGMSETDKLAHIFKREASELRPPAHVVFVPHDERTSIFEQNMKLSRAVMRAIATREGVTNVCEKELLPENVARKAFGELGGRMEHTNVTVDGSPVRIVLDVAHVAESVDLVLRELQTSVGSEYSGQSPVVLMGMGSDKGLGRIGTVISDYGIEVLGTCPVGKNEYLATQDLIAEEMSRAGVPTVRAFGSAHEMFSWGVRLAKDRETYVIVFGGNLVAIAKNELLAISSGKTNSS